MEKHYLTEVDPTNRTALCRKCGPVSVTSKGRGKFRCSVAKAEHRGQDSREPQTKYEFEGGHFYLTQSKKNALKQGKVCAICGAASALVIDHCHQTGRIRGVVCTHCNWLLGHARDNPDILTRAIGYLTKDP